MDILVIPDAHATPGIDNERFELLGKLIADRKPAKVVSIGDFADMPSLFLADKGKKCYEGRRYLDDINVTIDAQNRMFAPILAEMKKAKKWKPEFYITLGNHEQRIQKAIEAEPMLDGAISLADLAYEEFGWRVSKFRDVLELDGIFFNHYFSNGNMDKAMSGVSAPRNMLAEKARSMVSGHSHLLQHAIKTSLDGTKIKALVVGCYFDHIVDYASPECQKTWWRGVFGLTLTDDQAYDIEEISLSRIKKTYGSSNTNKKRVR